MENSNNSKMRFDFFILHNHYRTFTSFQKLLIEVALSRKKCHKNSLNIGKNGKCHKKNFSV